MGHKEISKSGGGGGGAGVYSKLLCTLAWGRTSLHIMNLQIRVGRGVEKGDKKLQVFTINPPPPPTDTIFSTIELLTFF